MTTIEIAPDRIYLSTDDRSELLELMSFIVKNFERMESRGQKQITLFEFREIPPPPMIKEERQ